MSLSTSSSADGHSGCFRVLAVASRTAVRLGPVRHSELRFSLVTCPGMGLLGHMEALVISKSYFPTQSLSFLALKWAHNSSLLGLCGGLKLDLTGEKYLRK